MERRTLWIIVGVTAALTACVCVLAMVGGFLFFRINSSEREAADAFATIEVEIGTPPAFAEATAAPLPPAATSAPLPRATPAPTAPQNIPAAPVDMPSGPPPDFNAALLPNAQDDLTRITGESVYQINARLDPDQRRIVGAQRVQYTNTEDVPLDAIYFRLYVNAPHYNEGGISVENVQVNGAEAQTTLEVNDTVLKIALPQPLAPGQQAEITMRFTTTVPEDGGYGIFQVEDGTFTLYNWHPELAVYEQGGWLLNPITKQGDPTNTDGANYAVTFAAPTGYQVVTSGVEAEPTEANDLMTHQIVSALTRNFVIVAGDTFEVVSEQTGDVTVNSYFLPNDQAGGNQALTTAAQSIDLFSQQFGPYPYPEVDVVEVRLGGGAAGMESTGMIMLGRDYYAPEQSGSMQGLESLVPGADALNVLGFVTAHEIAHQWWYSTLGSDAYKQPWLDESLTNWSAAYFYEETAGEQVGLLARDLFVSSGYRAILARGDERLDQPVDQFSELEYSTIVYGKGALMYDALRQQIGDEQFFAFLRRYYEQYQFERASGAEWRATLAEVIGEEQAQAFYQKWVEGTSITAADLPPGGPLSEVLGGMGNLEELLPTPEQ